MTTGAGRSGGADVSIAMSPIAIAAKNGHIEVARKLLASGASLETGTCGRDYFTIVTRTAA